MWLGLYESEQIDIPSQVGAGAGLMHPPVATIPLFDAGEEGSEPTATQGALAVSKMHRSQYRKQGVSLPRHLALILAM